MEYRYEVKCLFGSKKTNLFSCAVLQGIALLEQLKAKGFDPCLWWIDLIDHVENRHKLVYNPDSGDFIHKEWVEIF